MKLLCEKLRKIDPPYFVPLCCPEKLTPLLCFWQPEFPKEVAGYLFLIPAVCLLKMAGKFKSVEDNSLMHELELKASLRRERC
jgi:hypothetical protein